MYRLNLIAVLLAGSLLAFGPAAVGQDCNCKQDCKSCNHDCSSCNCKKKAINAEQSQASTQRQKPYGDSPRAMAPGDLPRVVEDEAALAKEAAEVVSAGLSQDRLRSAKAVAVIPKVRKGAFIFGGLMTMRDENGHWLPPAFIQITGDNFGLQAGYESTDLVLIFTDEKAIESLLKSKLTLNTDAPAASPFVGRDIGADAPVRLKGGIYSYSRSKGVLAGASLDGAVIKVDDHSNARIYGEGISGEAILLSRSVEPNAAVASFLDALECRGMRTNQAQTEN
jgi:lipid-binding SYLF domain-containing protein